MLNRLLKDLADLKGKSMITLKEPIKRVIQILDIVDGKVTVISEFTVPADAKLLDIHAVKTSSWNISVDWNE